MLDITTKQSDNLVCINGVLKELDIATRKTSDGRDYVSGQMIIRVDQECSGEMQECEIPVKMFSMKLKQDGSTNAIYEGILKMKEKYTSLAAAETPSEATRISINSGSIKENFFVSKRGVSVSDFQIETNFAGEGRDDNEDKATFELTGVVVSKVREIDREEQQTGRLIVKLVVVGYKGCANVLDFYVESPQSVDWIETNWKDGDTVRVAGLIKVTYKHIETVEEMGFGEPIKKIRTESKRELVITSGSATGLSEDFSYDATDIKNALGERKVMHDSIIEKNKAKAKKSAKPASTDFGF